MGVFIIFLRRKFRALSIIIRDKIDFCALHFGLLRAVSAHSVEIFLLIKTLFIDIFFPSNFVVYVSYVKFWIVQWVILTPTP